MKLFAKADQIVMKKIVIAFISLTIAQALLSAWLYYKYTKAESNTDFFLLKYNDCAIETDKIKDSQEFVLLSQLIQIGPKQNPIQQVYAFHGKQSEDECKAAAKKLRNLNASYWCRDGKNIK